MTEVSKAKREEERVFERVRRVGKQRGRVNSGKVSGTVDVRSENIDCLTCALVVITVLVA